MYRIIVPRKVIKQFKKYDKGLQDRFSMALELLRSNPYLGKRLHGELEGSYRVRVGDFRIVYGIDRKSNSIIIEAIGGRGDIYK